MSAWRHARAVALLPALVTLAVPTVILLLGRDEHPGWRLRSPLAALPFALAAALFVAGAALMISTVRLFASRGRGTLAPWDPTQRLVVEGPYRHVRNPMISGVIAILLGEAAFFGSPLLAGWAGLFALANAVYIPLSEEPGLEARFGEEYRAYRRHVPRWLPRLTPWQGNS